MRMYADPLEMVKEVERDLFEMGVQVHPETMQDRVVAGDDDYRTVELFSYAYSVTNLELDGLRRMVEYLGGNLAWAEAELRDRVSQEWVNPGDAWKMAEGTWGAFVRDGQFAYTYNERLREQLPQVVRELRVRPNTRQAVVTMYDRHQDVGNWGGKDRVPCSLHYQFYLRAGRLNVIYSMRSCDFLTHFVHDVYLAAGVLRHVADAVGVPVGTLTHFLGSLHAYSKDMESRGIF